MATTNGRNIIIRLSKDSKHLEDNKILTEAYENCEHNKSESFIHSIMNIEDDNSNDMYMTIIYENKFNKDIIKNLLELENTNENRTNYGIATKGIGMKHVFHKYTKHIEIMSLTKENLDFYFKFNLEDHVKELEKNKEIDVISSYDKRTYISEEQSLKKFFKNNYQIKTIIETINNEIDTYNDQNLNEDKIKNHCGYIFIKLNDEYNNMAFDEMNYKIEELKKICGIKFFYKLDNIPYFFHKKFGEFDQFEKVNKYDVLFYNDSYDMFSWYIKKLKINSKRDDWIVYFKYKSDYYYFKYTLEGSKLGKFTKIDEDNNNELYNKCKELNNKNCDHSYEYYNIGTDNKDKLSNYITDSIEKYTGFYYLLDNIILNDKPQDVSEILESQSRNTPGKSMARHVLKINKKEIHDIRGIKSEFTIKGDKNKKLLKYLSKILNF